MMTARVGSGIVHIGGSGGSGFKSSNVSSSHKGPTRLPVGSGRGQKDRAISIKLPRFGSGKSHASESSEECLRALRPIDSDLPDCATLFLFAETELRCLSGPSRLNRISDLQLFVVWAVFSRLLEVKKKWAFLESVNSSNERDAGQT